MSRSVIKKIAKQNRVSVAEVRRDIQAAIDAAYENPNTAALAVPRNGAIPTPEEFIDYCADVINTKPLRMHVLH